MCQHRGATEEGRPCWRASSGAGSWWWTRFPTPAPIRGRCWSVRWPAGSAARTCTSCATPSAWCPCRSSCCPPWGPWPSWPFPASICRRTSSWDTSSAARSSRRAPTPPPPSREPGSCRCRLWSPPVACTSWPTTTPIPAGMASRCSSPPRSRWRCRITWPPTRRHSPSPWPSASTPWPNRPSGPLTPPWWSAAALSAWRSSPRSVWPGWRRSWPPTLPGAACAGHPDGGHGGG